MNGAGTRLGAGTGTGIGWGTGTGTGIGWGTGTGIGWGTGTGTFKYLSIQILFSFLTSVIISRSRWRVTYTGRGGVEVSQTHGRLREFSASLNRSLASVETEGWSVTLLLLHCVNTIPHTTYWRIRSNAMRAYQVQAVKYNTPTWLSKKVASVTF